MVLPFELDLLAGQLIAQGHEVTRMTDDPMITVELDGSTNLDIERLRVAGHCPAQHAYYLTVRVYARWDNDMVSEKTIAEVAEGNEYLIPVMVRAMVDHVSEQNAKEDALWSGE